MKLSDRLSLPPETSPPGLPVSGNVLDAQVRIRDFLVVALSAKALHVRVGLDTAIGTLLSEA